MSSSAIGAARAVIAEVLAAVEKKPIRLLVPFDATAPGPEAQAAFDAMQADTRDFAALASKLVADFGFDAKEGLRGPSIRDPRHQLDLVDFGAVLAVAAALEVEPARVLTLWIIEGKAVHNALLRGSQLTWDVPEAMATKEPRRVRAFARSMILYKAFGSDKFTAYVPRAGAGGDNLLEGPDGAHDWAFGHQLEKVRAAGIPGLSEHTDDEVTRSFRDVGGALQVQTAPSGDPREIKFRIAPNSLASWLYLQSALFALYTRDAEAFFLDKYGATLTLDGRPWVTYVQWNGGPNAMKMFFDPTTFEDAEDAIGSRFGDVDHPAPLKLTTQQLDRYYGRGSSAGQSSAALANAITFLHVYSIVTPWFADG